MKMKITYPTWKVQGSPTPNETLWICPACGKAAWGAAGIPSSCSCQGRKGGFMRCRAATKAETAEGKRHLTKIIGESPPPAPVTIGKAAPLPPGVKPLYVLKFIGNHYNGLYYSLAVSWQGVSREHADEFDHKAALKAQGRLKRLGLASLLEPAIVEK